MVRLIFILCLLAGTAWAETDAKTTPDEPVEVAPECDTCLARKNGKRLLREYLAKKRAEEEAEDAKDD